VPQREPDAARPDAMPVVPVLDAASPADACVCRAMSMVGRLGFDPHTAPNVNGLAIASGCAAEFSDGQFSVDGELMGGGAALEDGPNEFRAWLTTAGFYWLDIFPREGDVVPEFLGWYGRWRIPVRDEGRQIITTAACLLPAEPGAMCARELWVSYSIETSSVPAAQQADLRVSCQDGVLVSGACSADNTAFLDVAVIRAGFAPDDRDTWLCSFVNHSDVDDYEVMAGAFCLHENPLPAECGCCPSLADSIVIAQEDAPLRFGANRLQVQCGEGQVMAIGNCMIDSPDVAAVKDVTMFRAGFVPTPEHPNGDYSTWGCSWYNPTGDTPRAVATAVCLPGD
jgi:hypothetical protein